MWDPTHSTSSILRVDRPDQQQQSKSSQRNGELWAIIVAFQSLFAYLQNLSATINLPDVQLPEQLRSILQYITRFIDLLILSIPTIPAFDLRAELAIVSFVLPFLVIIFFLWFVTPFYHVAYQLLDLLVLICVSMVLADAFTVSWTQVATIVLSFSGFYFLIRITMRVVKSRPSPWDLDDFAVHVCHYFMNEVIPGVQSALSRAELEDAIWKFSRYVDLARRWRTSKLSKFGSVVAFLAIFTVNLWSIGVIPSCPPLLAAFFPYVGFPLCLVLLLPLTLSFCQSGRSVLLRIRRFCKRWGLRLLMLALELLYIPISTQAIPLVFAKQTGCEFGEYLKYERAGTDPLFAFVNHTAVCEVCSPVFMSPGCTEACGGQTEFRLIEYPNLLLVDDVFWTSGGLLISAVLVWLIGIPLLFLAVVRTNKRFVRQVFVYGANIEAKWVALLHRLDSTGIFLFSVYKYNRAWWSVAVFGMRFGVMLITTVAGRIWPPAVIALPLWCAGNTFACWRLSPFLHRPNTILNIGLYGLNTLFAVIPVLSWAGIELPEGAAQPIAIVLIIGPALCALALLFCRGQVIDPEDPTIKHRSRNRRDEPRSYTAVEETEQSAEVANHRRIKELRPKHGLLGKKREDHHAPLIDAADDRRPEFVGDPGVDCRIERGFMDSIARVESRGRKTDEFVVGKNKISVLTTQMYQVLDIVLDGATIAMLARALYWSLILGALGFGWYFGAVRGMVAIRNELACGPSN